MIVAIASLSRLIAIDNKQPEEFNPHKNVLPRIDEEMFTCGPCENRYADELCDLCCGCCCYTPWVFTSPPRYTMETRWAILCAVPTLGISLALYCCGCCDPPTRENLDA